LGESAGGRVVEEECTANPHRRRKNIETRTLLAMLGRDVETPIQLKMAVKGGKLDTSYCPEPTGKREDAKRNKSRGNRGSVKGAQDEKKTAQATIRTVKKFERAHPFNTSENEKLLTATIDRAAPHAKIGGTPDRRKHAIGNKEKGLQNQRAEKKKVNIEGNDKKRRK